MGIIRNCIPRTGIILSLLGVLGCAQPAAISVDRTADASIPSSDEKTLVLADISDNPKKKFRKFQPLADYLAQNLDQFDRGKVKIAPDMDTMIAWLQSGEVDLYFDSPYPAILVMQDAQAKPILRRLKRGQAQYSSYIFALKDSNINSLTDLQGKKVAFDHPFSTTGYMLPKVELLKAGVTSLVELGTPASTLPDHAVGYVFTHEDENSIEWVLSGKVAAAAVDNYTFEKISPQIKDNLVVIAKTNEVDRNFVMVSADIPPDEIDAITSVLLDMDDSPQGQDVLQKFSKTTKFEQLDQDSSLKLIKGAMRQLQAYEDKE